jgi:hypothetical protein
MVDFVGMRTQDDSGVWHIEPDRTSFDMERFAKLRPNQPFLCKVTFIRSLKHHRWYRALVGVVADGIGMHPDLLHQQLKFKAEYVRNFFLQNGRLIVNLKSVAHGEMDETEFKEFREVAVNIIFRDYLDGVRRKDVWRRVEEIVGPCPW